MFDSNKMDRLITLQTSTATRSASGQEIVTWSNLATMWAEVVPRSGREYFGANQNIAEVDAIFRIRYRDGIRPEMRIQYQQQTYNIRWVQELGRREGLELVGQIIRID